jgi:O-antigen chain-terminating methyltransferase
MPPARVVLSAGCSGPWYFEWLNEKHPSSIERHIGFDLGPRPDDLPAEIEYHQRSFCDLSPIADESVDLIFAGQAIEHIAAEDSLDFFQHAHRVLKKDAWLVLDSPNFTITNPWPYVNPEHVIEYTPKQMKNILKAAGFEVARVKGLLLCRENKKVLDEPYDYQRIDERRIREGKHRPEDSFIWWIEARNRGRFNERKLTGFLKRATREYERDLARMAKQREIEARKAAKQEQQPHGSGPRRLARRLVPRRIRWASKATFKRITGLYHRDQMRLLTDTRDRVGELQAAVPILSSKLDTQDELIAMILRRLRIAQDEFDAATHSLSEGVEGLRALRDDLTKRAADLDRVVRLLAPAASSTSVFWASPRDEQGEDELVMTRGLSDFYIEFQNRHRGSEELIRERQRGRVPYFQSCRRVLDIGCGRGEFLELLREHGIPAEGIDLTDSAVETCVAKGLSVVRAEAHAFLAAKDPGTFDGIHMSHVLEHIPFGAAVALLETCEQHLALGGVIVAETPNPHSPEALQAFFLDPTHVRPLFPEALVVLLESLGLRDVEAHFLNPVRPAAGDVTTVPQDFADYLVVGIKARKPGVNGSGQHESQPVQRSTTNA